MTDSIQTAMREELQKVAAEFLIDNDREKRLYDLIDKLPNKQLLVTQNGDIILIEQSYTTGRVMVHRNLTVVGGSALQ